jgi:GTPase SAR1 family protein
MEKIKLKNCLLQIHDMSGQGKYRAMWERCFSDCDAIVFVIDSSDRLSLLCSTTVSTDYQQIYVFLTFECTLLIIIAWGINEILFSSSF